MSRKFNYMLRKTLVPWRMQETIEEVLGYCLANGVGEVMWKIEAEQFNRGFTMPEMIRDEYLPWLKKAKVKFDKAGIITSINPWMTLNHSDYFGMDIAIEGIGWMVGHDGKQGKKCACPLSKFFVEHLIECYKLYASVEPDILWVEDDFRNFNHSPVEWGCFCELHLERFSKLVGQKVTREELVKNILQPGVPHPWRAKWMDFLGDVMIQLASTLGQAVRHVSPQTAIGLMTSIPDDHSIEGRKWEKLILGLAGDNQAIVRPHFGFYRNTGINDIFICSDVLRQTVSCLPEGVRICPELENAPFTEYVKSVKFTKAQINLSAAMGYSDITMNLYDHCGTSLDKDDNYGIMLRENKYYLEGLLEYCRPNGQYRGIGLIFSSENAKFVHTEKGEDFTELHAKGLGWSTALQSLGFAVNFGDSNVYAITGQATRVLTEDQILELLSKGVLLDSSAAKVLIEQGYGEYIGVEIGNSFKKIDKPIAGEDIGNEIYISPRLATSDERLYELVPSKGTQIMSSFVTPEREFLIPAMTAFENSLGGRICVYSMDIHNGTTCCFLSWHRRNQFRHVFDWLGKGTIDLFIGPGSHSLPLRIDYQDYSVILVVNSSPDSWQKIEFEMAMDQNNISEILMIDNSGRWDNIKPQMWQNLDGKLKLSLNQKLDFLSQAVFCVKYK